MALEKIYITLTFVFCFFLASDLKAEGEVRFSKNVKIDTQLLQVKVSKTAGSWRVSLSEKKAAQILLKSTIPEWVAASYYDYSLLSRTIDGHPIIIFEARPTPGLSAPKNADIIQFAWMRKNMRWKTIASTQTSTLEGSDQLQFRKEGNKQALVRIQSKNSNLFCGDRLGVYKVFSPDDDNFRSKLRLGSLLRDIPTLNSTIPPVPFIPSIYSGFSRWTFASSKENRVRNGTLIRPEKLGDGSTLSYWAEGMKERSRGEFVTAKLNNALKITGFRIFPGDGKSEKDFLSSSRPTKILVSLSSGVRFKVNLQNVEFKTLNDARGLVVRFPQPIRSSCMSVVILSASGDPKAASISEISPMTELDGLDKKIAALVVVEKLLGGKKTRPNRKLAQVTYPIRAELAHLLTRMLKNGSIDDRKIIPLLRNLPSNTTLPILIQLFERIQTWDPSYRLLKPLLATHENSADALIELYENRPPVDPKKRIDLIRLLGRTKGLRGPTALLDSLGEGDLSMRQEKMRSVARAGKLILPALFSIADKNGNSSKSEDALTTINKISKHLYRNKKGTLLNEKITKIFSESTTRKRRALVAKTASYFSFTGDFVFYETLLSNPDPLLRKFGVLGFKNLMTESARLALEKALTDSSPDVRIEAIQAFSKRSDRSKSSEALMRFVESEKWGEGLRPGCSALAKIGDHAALQTLGKLVSRNQTVESVIASKALVKARKSLPAEEIERLLVDPKTELRFAFSLIEMLGVETIDANEKLLLRIINDKNFVKNQDPKSRYKIEKRAIFSIGRQQSRGAAKTLFGLLRNEANGSKIQATILRAFAFQSDPWVLRELQSFEEGMSESTTVILQYTINSIQRRIDLKKLSDAIDVAE